jgi:predicted transcriptional regulator
MRDVHVTLSDDLARRVDQMARECRESRNVLIRRAIETLFEIKRRRRIAEQMRSYAEALAEHSDDFLDETGPLVSRKLLEDTRW